MSPSQKRSINLSPELAAMVDEAVATGDYEDASEVVREALSEWRERRDLFGYTLEELRQLVQEGLDSGPAEPFTEHTIRSIKERGRQRLAEQQNQRAEATARASAVSSHCGTVPIPVG